jgi:NAD(P)H-dependent FMN reductase
MYLIFVASLNENMKLAKILQKQLESENKSSLLINLVDLELPMYDSFKEENDGIPKKVLELIEKMKDAKGYIFVSPEYNYSLPPVLVNTIAWISRVGDDFREVFTLKPIQLATHSGGGGSDVMNAMRNQFTKLGSLVLPREIITTYQNPLRADSSLRILKQFTQVAKD